MTERICRRCGGDLTEEARFCSKCGEIANVARGAVLYTLETLPPAKEKTEQAVPPYAAPTEEMPAILKSRNESSD